MIRGIGVDILEVERLKKAFLRWREKIKEKIFTPRELSYMGVYRNSFWERAAGRFCAKEAVSKCLGVNLMGVNWKEIEILSSPGGIPRVILKGRLKKEAQKQGVKKILVSISHTKGYAVASAVSMGE